MALPFTPSFPFLLYSYPWMPYPRRLTLYLRENRIPSTTVRNIRVSDPGAGNRVIDCDSSIPPRPPGSLPILAIPHADEEGKWTYIRQSMAIINFLEELCERREYAFDDSRLALTLTSMDLLGQARHNEILTLAEELTVGWNPVRMFGTGAGTIPFPAGAREMLRWERRSLLAIESYLAEDEGAVTLVKDAANKDKPASLAAIVLYQFLEFTKDCYGVNMTVGSGKVVRDVYGREVREEFPRLKEFFEVFGKRKSARRLREDGEVPPEGAAKAMGTWADGVL